MLAVSFVLVFIFNSTYFTLISIERYRFFDWTIIKWNRKSNQSKTDFFFYLATVNAFSNSTNLSTTMSSTANENVWINNESCDANVRFMSCVFVLFCFSKRSKNQQQNFNIQITDSKINILFKMVSFTKFAWFKLDFIVRHFDRTLTIIIRVSLLLFSINAKQWFKINCLFFCQLSILHL